ncbi:hypothetical protein EN12_24465 [Vibrio cholerae]|nr:hypothetical protein EN12_24465 [Vibrio cholerae]
MVLEDRAFRGCARVRGLCPIPVINPIDVDSVTVRVSYPTMDKIITIDFHVNRIASEFMEGYSEIMAATANKLRSGIVV